MKTYYLTLLVLFLFVSCSKDVEPEVIPNYNLKVSISPVEGGTVTPSEGSYQNGTVLSLLAKPSSEYIFKEWTGGVTGTTNPISVTMNSNKNVSVVFEKRKYPLSIIIEGEGTVTEELLQSKSNTDYPSGSVVKLTAVPVDGWEFVEWSGNYEGTDNPITVTVDKEKILTVKFNKKQVLFVSKSPIYPYPSNTSGEMISNYYYPGDSLFGKQVRELITDIPEGYEIENSGVNFLDIGNDGILDMIGYFAYSNWGQPKAGYFFVVRDVFGNPIVSKFETPLVIVPRFEINDFNGDGNMDAVVISTNHHANTESNTYGDLLPINLYLFNEDGTFEYKEIGDPIENHDVATGDIDNDGDIDILMWGADVNGSRVMGIHLNDGFGNFNFRTDLIHEIDDRYIRSYHSLSHRFFDIDGDGCLDLIAGASFDSKLVEKNNGYPYSIYWGDCTGNFYLNSKSTILPNVLSEDIQDYSFLVLGISFIDFDNDGDYDIVTSTTSEDYLTMKYYIQLIENKGNRVFEDVTNKNVSDSYKINPISGKPQHFYRTRIYDIDNDGDFDIIPYHSHLDEYYINTYWENNSGYFIKIGPD